MPTEEHIWTAAVTIDFEMAIVAGTRAEAERLASRHMREELRTIDTEDHAHVSLYKDLVPAGWNDEDCPYNADDSCDVRTIGDWRAEVAND